MTAGCSGIVRSWVDGPASVKSESGSDNAFVSWIFFFFLIPLFVENQTPCVLSRHQGKWYSYLEMAFPSSRP